MHKKKKKNFAWENQKERMHKHIIFVDNLQFVLQ